MLRNYIEADYKCTKNIITHTFSRDKELKGIQDKTEKGRCQFTNWFCWMAKNEWMIDNREQIDEKGGGMRGQEREGGWIKEWMMEGPDLNDNEKYSSCCEIANIWSICCVAIYLNVEKSIKWGLSHTATHLELSHLEFCNFYVTLWLQ